MERKVTGKKIDPTEVYSHFPLTTSSSIRLLQPTVSQPQGSDAILRCELKVVSLDNHSSIDFAALSYTWHHPIRSSDLEDERARLNQHEDREVIYCKDYGLQITRNLFQYLLLYCKTARPNGSFEWLWVDAISINQEDPAERSRQVLIMDRIYNVATVVIVWLGETDRHSEVALDIISLLGRAVDCASAADQNLISFVKARALDDQAVWRKLGITKFEPEQWRAVGHFLSRSWFTRVWTLQEVLLAQKVVILCGDGTLDDRLLRVATLFLVLTGWNQLLPSFSQHSSNEAMIRDAGKAILEWNRQLSKHIDLERGLHNAKRGFTDALYDIRFRARTREASDPRDQIYGYIPLARQFMATPDEPSLKPDYSKTVQQVYAEATRFFIEKQQRLFILAFAQSRTYSAQGDIHLRPEDAFPSWVPRYDQPRELVLFLTDYRATGNSKHQALQDSNEMQLSVRGFPLETPLVTLPNGPDLFQSMLDFATELKAKGVELAHRQYSLKICLEILLCNNFATSVNPIIEGNDGSDMFLYLQGLWIDNLIERFVTDAEGSLDGRNTISMNMDDLGRMVQSIPVLKDVVFPNCSSWGRDNLNPALQNYMELASEVLRQRLLKALQVRHADLKYIFRSESTSVVGAVYHQYQAGDQIWYLLGSPIPFFLRPVPNQKDQPELYQLKGPAYVHGFMKGEILETEWAKNERIITLI